MSVKLLTECHLEFLSLKGGCTGSSKPSLVKMPHCWKSHVAAHFSGGHFVRLAILVEAFMKIILNLWEVLFKDFSL